MAFSISSLFVVTGRIPRLSSSVLFQLTFFNLKVRSYSSFSGSPLSRSKLFWSDIPSGTLWISNGHILQLVTTAIFNMLERASSRVGVVHMVYLSDDRHVWSKINVVEKSLPVGTGCSVVPVWVFTVHIADQDCFLSPKHEGFHFRFRRSLKGSKVDRKIRMIQ